MSRLGWVAAMIVLSLSCGSEASITDGAREAVEPLVEQVRAAVEAGQPDVAAQRLAELRARIEPLRQAGEISDTRAAEILGSLQEVESRLLLITTTTTAATTPTTAPATPPATDGPNEDAKDEHKQGQGRRGDKKAR